MKLADYTKNPEGRAELARALGVTEEAVRLWEKGERTPRSKMQARIMKLTKNKVTPWDFLPQPEQAA